MPWQGKKGFGAPRSVSCGFDKQVDKNVKCNYRPQRGRDSPGFASLEKHFPLIGVRVLHLTGVTGASKRVPWRVSSGVSFLPETCWCFPTTSTFEKLTGTHRFWLLPLIITSRSLKVRGSSSRLAFSPLIGSRVSSKAVKDVVQPLG